MLLEISLKKSPFGKFRGDGWIGKDRFRLALGTGRKDVALRRISLLERGAQEGADSAIWAELKEALPRRTFETFASAVGYREQPKPVEPPKQTWTDLRLRYEEHLEKEITKGNLRQSTRDRYLQTLKHFQRFLDEKNVSVFSDITKSLIESWKLHRIEEIKQKPNARGGKGYVLDVAILRAVFNFAREEKIASENPVKSEGKPGADPENGAHPFTPDELAKIMEHAAGDRLTVLVLFRTGLRRSDAIRLRWKNVDFQNLQISLVAQKNGKKVRIPILPDLLFALERAKDDRNPLPEDLVLLALPQKPFSGKGLYERLRAVGRRAGVADVRPHRFRDSFAADSFLRGCDTEEVAAYLGDTVATVATHYAEFIEERRKRADAKMRNGEGLVDFAPVFPTTVEV